MLSLVKIANIEDNRVGTILKQRSIELIKYKVKVFERQI